MHMEIHLPVQQSALGMTYFEQIQTKKMDCTHHMTNSISQLPCGSDRAFPLIYILILVKSICEESSGQ